MYRFLKNFAVKCVCLWHTSLFFFYIFSFQNTWNNIAALWWEFFSGRTVGFSCRKQWSIRSESDYFRTTDMKITFLKQCVKPKMCYNVSISQEFRSKVCLSMTHFTVFSFQNTCNNILALWWEFFSGRTVEFSCRKQWSIVYGVVSIIIW